jgi:hypothetical protein
VNANTATATTATAEALRRPLRAITDRATAYRVVAGRGR